MHRLKKVPFPERRRLNFTQDALGKPRGVVLTLVMKAWIADILVKRSTFRFVFDRCAARVSISDAV